jgi:hypothetical protein
LEAYCYLRYEANPGSEELRLVHQMMLRRQSSPQLQMKVSRFCCQSLLATDAMPAVLPQ